MRAGAKICGYGKHKMANPDYSFMRTGLGAVWRVIRHGGRAGAR